MSLALSLGLSTLHRKRIVFHPCETTESFCEHLTDEIVYPLKKMHVNVDAGFEVAQAESLPASGGDAVHFLCLNRLERNWLPTPSVPSGKIPWVEGACWQAPVRGD